mmetsp:Transcript_12875/g.36441  ORF Transcript_12875/g.36441 Transcript_12875/m.36441 type:complete len:115 (-) Transcript_12875:30-374(-)
MSREVLNLMKSWDIQANQREIPASRLTMQRAKSSAVAYPGSVAVAPTMTPEEHPHGRAWPNASNIHRVQNNFEEPGEVENFWIEIDIQYSLTTDTSQAENQEDTDPLVNNTFIR